MIYVTLRYQGSLFLSTGYFPSTAFLCRLSRRQHWIRIFKILAFQASILYWRLKAIPFKFTLVYLCFFWIRDHDHTSSKTLALQASILHWRLRAIPIKLTLVFLKLFLKTRSWSYWKSCSGYCSKQIIHLHMNFAKDVRTHWNPAAKEKKSWV